MRRLRRRIGEQVSSLLKSVGGWGNFWKKTSWGAPNQVVDYELARELYSNSNPEYRLGAAFVRRIINATVEFVGLPRVSSKDPEVDDWLNESIYDWWADALQQLIRNASRDSKTVVRIAPYEWRTNPLISAEDSDRIAMEVIEPERVRIYYDPFNSDVIDMAVVHHRIPMIDDTIDNLTADEPWNEPQESIHEVMEILTRDKIRYYDKTNAEWLTEHEQRNTWGFVPLSEIHNDWDETLGRGQSDVEAAFPFIKAFHDVLQQSLAAHGYHSIPKVKFKINDIMTFLQNNWPGSFDADGKFTGTVDWQGKEILFMQSEEDVEFLEAESVLGESKTLLEFLFDCICIASETPGWVLLGNSRGEEEAPIAFVKKIVRRRRNFSNDLRKLFKMALVMSGRRPFHVKMAWDTVRPEDESVFMRAFQEKVMALEVAAQRKIISDATYRTEIRPYIPSMKNAEAEAREAEDNYVPEIDLAGDGNAQNGNVPVAAQPGAGGANE